MTILSFLMILLTSFSFAADNCHSSLTNYLYTESSKYVYNYNKNVFLQFIDCEGFPNSFNSMMSIVVATHEGVHLHDLGWKLGQDNNGTNLANILTFNLSKSPVNKRGVYSQIFNTVDPIIQNKFKDLLADTESDFAISYAAYILDKDMLSAKSFELGIFIEWNAYNHGSLIEWELRKNDLKYKLFLTQRTSSLFFLSMSKLYLHELYKKGNPEWVALQNNTEIVTALKNLISDTVEMLEKTKACYENEQEYQDMANVYRLISPNTALKKIIGEELLEKLETHIYCNIL